MNIRRIVTTLLVASVATCGAMSAATVYLNHANMSVALGPSMAPEPFAFRTTAEALASVIDAPSASASEFHSQSTHVFVLGNLLELAFNFGSEHDLTMFHFWNY